MANEPPNPYAPTDALAHDLPAAEPRRPSRLATAVVTFFSFPFAGGFYLLGRRRPFAAWTAAAFASAAVLVGSVWAPVPKLFVVIAPVPVLLALAALTATAMAKPGRAPHPRPVLAAVLLIAAAIGCNVALGALVEAFKIPSGAMVPTLLPGDHIMVKKKHGDVQRGDVIVFKFPQDPSVDYIKRVVAMGGDTIEVRDGVPSINGVPLEHQAIDQPCSYIDEASPIPDERGESCTLVRETNAGRTYTIMLAKGATAPDHPRTVVPPGELFVMGDNRDNSFDSRRWGTVKPELVKGRPTLTWWSSARSGINWSRIGHRIE